MEDENIKKTSPVGKRVVVVLVAAILAGSLLGAIGTYSYIVKGGYVLVDKDDLEEMESECNRYSKLSYLYDKLRNEFYLDISEEDMMNGIYKGLFESAGDPYTSYLTSEEYEAMSSATTGRFYGIGVVLSANDKNEIIVVNTIEGSPAEDAGIRSGDIILEVEGKRYRGEDLSEAAAAMRGDLNTKVSIAYKRGSDVKKVSIVRKKITTQSVYSKMLDDKTGYIRITSFELSTAEDFGKELRSMEMRAVDGIIIDLRNNGGGIVDSGLEIADMLLPEGNIVYLEDRKGERTYHNSDPNSTNVPYVLLVNEGTASTSEILAAAVKDNDGGKIVGTKTFGKGIVQTLEQLKDNSGATRITTQQYFSPKGKTINKVGVEPDVIVKMDGERDTQLEKAMEILKRN